MVLDSSLQDGIIGILFQEGEEVPTVIDGDDAGLPALIFMEDEVQDTVPVQFLVFEETVEARFLRIHNLLEYGAVIPEDIPDGLLQDAVYLRVFKVEMREESLAAQFPDVLFFPVNPDAPVLHETGHLHTDLVGVKR